VSDRIRDTPIIERPDVAAQLVAKVADLRGCRVFMMAGCRIIVTQEPAGWHLSISRSDRDPT
jgi:hypothetical protein